jgi:Alpha-glutamyl/putrescinyl thymine pyrophosphorylase clade 3
VPLRPSDSFFCHSDLPEVTRVWPKRKGIAERLEAELSEANQRHLPGIAEPAAGATLAWQMVASLRRLDYTERLRERPISSERADPRSALFDPERAAILHVRAGRVDEAFWLTFLATHFGKHAVHGWRRLRDVYSGLGTGIRSWKRVSADPTAFGLGCGTTGLASAVGSAITANMRA